ncbi:MAG: D-glycerate dehydrogenase [Chloroflexia bacterium]|nr:D-glycerate dehydrogenase [Chloroflexia bacterium]
MALSWSVAVTRQIPEAGLSVLQESTTVKIWEEKLPPDEVQLRKLLAGCDGALTLLTDSIDGALLDSLPRLRVVSNFAVGYDNIDVNAASERGVLVCNTPDVLTNATADHTWALLLAAARRIPESIEFVRAGKWETWDPLLLLGQEVSGATIGIAGLGRIGKEVAKRARGFDMRILAFDPYEDEAFAEAHGVAYVTLEQLLEESDFVTLHVALTAETRHLIAAPELDRMKSSAILVNASRGPVIDTEALVAALRNDSILGAALDVTDPEPLPADHPLVTMPNCIVVPHTASATVQTRDRMADLAARNLLAGLRGERPPASVNGDEVLNR